MRPPACPASRSRTRARRAPRRGAGPRPGGLARDERGALTLMALLIILVVLVIGAGVLNSLLGEAAGSISYRYGANAFLVAEGGLNWAAARLRQVDAATFAGPVTQPLLAAGGQPVGEFTVQVFCLDGRPVGPDACATATPPYQPRPYRRLVRAEGFVPTRTGALGQRVLEAVLEQDTFFQHAVCGYEGVTLDQGVTVRGNVGSEADLMVGGPAINPARIRRAPDGSQPGNAYAVGTITCTAAGDCKTPVEQVEGTVNPGQAPGSVCPNRTEVRQTFVCTPGTTDATVGPPGATFTFTAANARSLRNLATERDTTIVFQTTALGEVLEVHLETLTAGQRTRVIVQGPGRVRLYVNSQMVLNQQARFGLVDADQNGSPDDANGDGVLDLVPAERLVVHSCNPGRPSPALAFNQTGQLSGLFIVPNGTVQMDQAQLSNGAILAGRVQFDRSTAFTFDATALNVGFGFTRLIAWQDLP